MRHRAIGAALQARYLQQQRMRLEERAADCFNLIARLIEVKGERVLADGSRQQRLGLNLAYMRQLLLKPADVMRQRFVAAPSCFTALFEDYPAQRERWQSVTTQLAKLVASDSGYCDFARIDRALQAINKAVGDQVYGGPRIANKGREDQFVYSLFWSDVVDACRTAVAKIKRVTPHAERFETISLDSSCDDSDRLSKK